MAIESCSFHDDGYSPRHFPGMYMRMVPFKLAALVASSIVTCTAGEIYVASSGGNATSGHQYGFLHEVRASYNMTYLVAKANNPRF